MIEAFFVFVLVTAIDYAWTYWIRTTATDKVIAAANWSGLIGTLQGILTVCISQNAWMIIPAGLGAWLGAYLSMRRATREKSRIDSGPTA